MDNDSRVYAISIIALLVCIAFLFGDSNIQERETSRAYWMLTNVIAGIHADIQDWISKPAHTDTIIEKTNSIIPAAPVREASCRIYSGNRGCYGLKNCDSDGNFNEGMTTYYNGTQLSTTC